MEEYDVFVSHAWEDKQGFVAPLVEALVNRGLNVWYDDLSLDVGDSLRESIDRGLGVSRFGVVVLSPAFFQKQWPARELNGLVQKAMGEGRKVVLPIWHDVSREDVEEYSYPLADLLAAQSRDGVDAVADAIQRVVSGESREQIVSAKREEASQRLIAAARKSISDPTQVVAVNDLTDAIARESYAGLAEQYDTNLQNANSLDVLAVLAEYRRVCFGVARLCALGANLGHSDHYGTWERALAIIARDPGPGKGRELDEMVWQYPVAYLLYSTGVAAMQRGRLGLVHRLLVNVRQEDRAYASLVPLAQWMRWDKIGQFVARIPDNRHKTPLSENLYAELQDVVMEYFVDENEYARVFDAFEFALLIAYLASEREKQHRWVPAARLLWRLQRSSKGLEVLAGEFERLNGVSLFLGGDKADFDDCVGLISNASNSSRYW